MKRLKSILRWGIGLIIGIYLTIILLLSLPFFQQWIGGLAAQSFSEAIGSKVEVGRIQLGLPGRLLIDDVNIWDQKGAKMLTAARVGAKIGWMPLFQKGHIQLNNVILFGAHANLYQEQPDSNTNFKYIIDAFSSQDKEKKEMPTISIGSILIRHASISFDRQWVAPTPGQFNMSHVNLKDVSLTAQLQHLSNDSLSCTLKKMSFVETSGFKLNNMSAQVFKVRDKLQITNLLVNTVGSQFSLPNTNIDIQNKKIDGLLEGRITPNDFKVFYRPLEKIQTPLNTSLSYCIDENTCVVNNLVLRSEDDNILDLNVHSAQISLQKEKYPNFSININNLKYSPEILEYIRKITDILPDDVCRTVNILGETALHGEFSTKNETSSFDINIKTEQGDADLKGYLKEKAIKTKIELKQFNVGKILVALQNKQGLPSDSISHIERISLNADADFSLPTNVIDGHIKGSLIQSLPTGQLHALVSEATINNYTYHNINLSANNKGGICSFKLDAKDPSLTLNLQGNVHISTNSPRLEGLIDIAHFRPKDLHLSKNGPMDVRTKIGVELEGNNLEDLTGDISIPHIIITDEKGSTTLSSIQLQSSINDDTRFVSLRSPYIYGSAEGAFDWSSLFCYLQQTAHKWIPGIVKAPTSIPAECKSNITFTLADPTPLERLLNIPLKLESGPLQLNATVDSNEHLLEINADAPSIGYGEDSLLNFCFSSHSEQDKMSTTMSASHFVKQAPVDVLLKIESENDLLTTRVNWDNHRYPSIKGDVALKGKISQKSDKIAVDGEVLSSSLQINDTLWNIHPTHLGYQDGVLNVQDFRMTMENGNRWLAVSGKASKSPEDTLSVNLRGIELAYIFSIVKLKPISLAGQVSGNLYGTHLFSQPEAHGHVTLPHLYFNEGDMGSCDANLAWGVTPGTLDIKAKLEDKEKNAWLDANGYLHLLKDPVQSLDLRINCQRANLHFLNRYVAGILDDVEGRVTGNVNVYGTFGDVDLAGNALIEEASTTIPALNTRYHIINEPVTLRPDGVILENIRGYDPMGGPGSSEHSATINGRVTYSHFRDMRFNFNIIGENVLAYNFPEFGDLPFCGTVYGTGNVQLSGSPGQTNIDIDARPTAGTMLTYKVASPETLTQSKFITFIDKKTSSSSTSDRDETDEEDTPEGDMTINFNLDLNPDAEMRLLMDPITGDYISLFGNSRLRASYYNKGSFKMYGTYHVDHGVYRMSIQDVIRKDFQFRQGGTIVFGGSPFQADLGLQAIYTVPSVSLNDLSTRGTFSNNNVRVNCIMNLGGKAGDPRVTFDFDIPNVNEDEQRMVRSLISTEEERNLQVIYLLGIGRFYTYDYTSAQAQSSTAMNSLLSTTLSGQLNQVFTSLMGGNQNWNIGANLSTGETGWSDMDVEGMLSGRLLNNRLLINGNFGYRDNPVAASNFIGDFDLQWILNKQGNLILKAYSETNDRYFTKSALTTQGVGLLVKKDFIRWSDLFKRKK